jgi:hypothetical protein
LALVALVAQLDKLAQRVAEQVVVTQYFPLLHLLVVAVAVLVAALKMVKQVVQVAVVVTKVALVALEIHQAHRQVKATTVEMVLLGAMVAVVVEAHLPLVQYHHLRLLAVLVVRVQHQASVALQ